MFASLTCDVDSLASIYKGYGLRHPQGYSGLEIRQGLENLCRFLEPYGIQATLFMVGNDFLIRENVSYIQSALKAGNEIANHTMTHAQGFRRLSQDEQDKEIGDMEVLCEQTIGEKPVGFRAPGWNMSDTALPSLLRRGYLYDSSIHPTSVTPLLKFLHWFSAPDRERGGRTTMGQWDYIFSSLKPYRSSASHLAKPGINGIVEFPVTVVPPFRLPFWHTVTVAGGMAIFKKSYSILKRKNMPINYLVHISDFVDFSQKELQEQMPDNRNRRIPKSMCIPLDEKKRILHKVVEAIAHDYHFLTLNNWAINV